MKMLWAGTALIGLVTTSSFAEPRYDRKIEQAAADIVAAKMGDIRGGFSYDVKPAAVAQQDVAQTGSIAAPDAPAADPFKDGLAPAVERKLSAF
jgi:hypothetical protein